jgi:hypothetical protein
MQRAKYVRNYAGKGLSTLEDSELFKGPGGATSTSPIHHGAADRGVQRVGQQTEMTDSHKMQLQKIRERDQLIVGHLSFISLCG